MVAKEKREKVIKVRCTKDEYFQIQDRQPDGVQLAPWIRKTMLGRDPQPVRKKLVRAPKADPELIREVAKIGSNLNQIAKGINRNNLMRRSVSLEYVAIQLVAIEMDLSLLIECDRQVAA